MVQIEPLLTELCALQVIVPCLRVSLSLMDFITYLVTKIIFIKSNIGDPTLKIWLKNEANVDG